ncbi:MAG: MFS transporter, partial [Caulobacterales bacterium]
IVFGFAWMVSVASFNIEVQIAAPRWVAGRTLAVFQASIAGGIAICGLIWGHVADVWNIEAAMIGAGLGLLLLSLVGFWLRMPVNSVAADDETEELDEPHMSLALTPRSGPIAIEIEYHVDTQNARMFYELIQQVRRTRQRNGAYGWSISRDISTPEIWVERFSCPTWHDYLRQRSRSTQAERELQLGLIEYHASDAPVKVRRLLERPFGSVRWREDSPDPAASAQAPIVVPGSPLG